MKKSLLIILSAIALTFASCRKEPVRVACVGDSITFGHGIKDRLHDAYPGVLSTMLGERYDVRNFGVSGTTTMMGTDMPYMNEQAYKEALEFNPQIVTIKLGTNDSKPLTGRRTGISSRISRPLSSHSAPCLPNLIYGYACRFPLWATNGASMTVSSTTE